jgi:hypothetical protein
VLRLDHGLEKTLLREQWHASRRNGSVDFVDSCRWIVRRRPTRRRETIDEGASQGEARGRPLKEAGMSILFWRRWCEIGRWCEIPISHRLARWCEIPISHHLTRESLPANGRRSFD